MTFEWGFSDHTPQLSPVADVNRLYTEVAPLRPQIWRLNVPWNYVAKARDPGAAVPGAVPPTTTNRDWSYVDRCINDLLLKVGCEILLMIGQGRPQWGGWLFGWGATAGNATDYGNFCAEVAQRYRVGGVGIRTDGIYASNAGKGVKLFEMWNEVNNAHFWGNAVDPLDYTRFLIAGHAGVKSVLPGNASKVLFVGMMHICRSPPYWGSGWGTMEEILFLTRCYEAAGKLGTTLSQHFDAMSEHIYTEADTVAYVAGSVLGPPPNAMVDNLMQLREIRALMNAKGDGAKGIYITEAGYPTHVVSAAQQNTYTQQLFNYLATLTDAYQPGGYIKAVLMYSARDAGTSGGGQDTYGALTWNWTRRPIYTYLQTLTPDGNRLVQPGPAMLSVVGSSPVVNNNVTVRPDALALTVTGAAPDVRVTQHRVAQPGPAAVVATGGVPVVTRTEHQLVQPAPAALTIVGGQPSLGNAVTVRPGAPTLTVTTGAPVVRLSDHKRLEPGAAALTVTPGTPAVRVSDHKRVEPGGAMLAVTGGAPTVTPSDHRRLTPGPAAVTITMGAPTVTVASTGVTTNVVGAGNSKTDFNTTAMSLQFPLAIGPGSNRRVYAFVGAGGSAWQDAGTSVGASITIGGTTTAMTLLGSMQRFGNSSGYTQATFGVFEIAVPNGVDASGAVVTITGGFWQNLNALMGNAICLNNAGAAGTLQVQNVGTGSVANQNITVPAGAVGDMVLVGLAAGGSNTRTGAWTAASLWFSVETNPPGDMDWMKLGYIADPDGAAKAFTGTNSARHTIAGVRVPKAA